MASWPNRWQQSAVKCSRLRICRASRLLRTLVAFQHPARCASAQSASVCCTVLPPVHPVGHLPPWPALSEAPASSSCCCLLRTCKEPRPSASTAHDGSGELATGAALVMCLYLGWDCAGSAISLRSALPRSVGGSGAGEGRADRRRPWGRALWSVRQYQRHR